MFTARSLNLTLADSVTADPEQEKKLAQAFFDNDGLNKGSDEKIQWALKVLGKKPDKFGVISIA